MKVYTSKLIIIRGNSASGKSSVAKKLREASSTHTALVEQDYLRRIVLKEKENESENNVELIYQTVVFALERNYNVILEGILYSPRYKKMLKKLIKRAPNHYIYYLDIPFEETLKRHTRKPVAKKYGEKEMRAWYNEFDVTNFENEVIISEKSSLDQTVQQIATESGLV